MARKLSVTDRTELNLNDDIYVTVYNNKASDYKELYSDEDVYADDKNNFKDYRVTSKTESRIVLPTLARNLAENASSITDTNGWEAMT
jgi:NhaP-type Na+/H+ and K+/H+ antiporter